ncbi:MAG: hypothetical protein ABIJ97_17310 [Bacteroidota bacterium]
MKIYIILLKLKYQIISILGKYTGNKQLLKRKIIIGGMIIGMISINSCGSSRERVTCYDTETVPNNDSIEIQSDTLQ